MPAPKLPCQKGGAFSARGVHARSLQGRWRRVAVNIRCPKGGTAEPPQSAGKFVRPKKDETAWRKMNPRGGGFSRWERRGNGGVTAVPVTEVGSRPAPLARVD